MNPNHSPKQITAEISRIMHGKKVTCFSTSYFAK